MALDGTGILGRSTGRLGRFGLARIPGATTTSGVPCPYVPSRQDDNMEAMQWPSFAPPQAEDAPQMSVVQDEAASLVAVFTEDAPLVQTGTDEYPVHQPAEETAPLREAEVLDTAPVSMATEDGQTTRSDETSEAAGQEPTAAAEDAPQVPTASAEEASQRRVECS